MTREEQIIEKASKDSEIFYKMNDNYGDCYKGGFVDGAKWADEHPNPNVIKKIFEFALGKTNFMIADSLQGVDFEVLVVQAMKE